MITCTHSPSKVVRIPNSFFVSLTIRKIWALKCPETWFLCGPSFFDAHFLRINPLKLLSSLWMFQQFRCTRHHINIWLSLYLPAGLSFLSSSLCDYVPPMLYCRNIGENKIKMKIIRFVRDNWDQRDFSPWIFLLCLWSKICNILRTNKDGKHDFHIHGKLTKRCNSKGV